MPFAGGIAQHGFQCGQIWGAVLAAGAEANRIYGAGPRGEYAAVRTAQSLVEAFRSTHGHVDCYDLTNIDTTASSWKLVRYFLLKGGTARCMRMAADYARVAHNEIVSSLHGDDTPPPNGPLSCASVLAARLHVADQHAVMVAGFAGGLGLCGGACGALGAALWLHTLRRCEAGTGKIAYDSPAVLELIEAFLECSGYQFECKAITGRNFVSVDEHAAWLESGGCSQLLESFADRCTTEDLISAVHRLFPTDDRDNDSRFFPSPYSDASGR